MVPLNRRDDIHEEVTENTGTAPVPLITRVPYGLGSVTVLAFDVEAAESPFRRWTGRTDFYKSLLQKLAPQVRKGGDQFAQMPMGRSGHEVSHDLSARLSEELDRFDTQPISFGWVAFFIFLYILVVGPLDYLILKKVFKRLEWTWITFPAVVLAVSVSAYLIAYAVKGNELKVNKIDLIDLDLRSDLDEQQQTRQAYAYGTTWFTLLSPRIQSYTIGIEPRVQTWADPAAATAPAMVSWLARPERGVSRGQMQGLFRRDYEYNYRALGVKDVPIPVWATKTFVASYATPLKKLPLEASLEYEPVAFQETPLTGTLKSRLPFDLEEVVLFYGGKWYPLSDLPATGAEVTVKLKGGQDMARWPQSRGDPHGGPGAQVEPYQPTPFVRDLMFHEKADVSKQYRNHAQRMLDQSWRLADDRVQAGQGRPAVTREAILFGRAARVRGSAEELTKKNDPRLPTHLWLGRLPGEAAQAGENTSRPELDGTLVQDTYVRVFLPVRPRVGNPK